MVAKPACLLCPYLGVAGKADELKAAVNSGKLDASVVVDDAMETFKQKAASLKKGASAEAAAAIDASVAAFEKKAGSLKEAVAAGKADGASALDAALAAVSEGAEQLKGVVATDGVDAAVKALTGVAGRWSDGLGAACSQSPAKST